MSIDSVPLTFGLQQCYDEGTNSHVMCVLHIRVIVSTLKKMLSGCVSRDHQLETDDVGGYL
jgi:hypothetical protein